MISIPTKGRTTANPNPLQTRYTRHKVAAPRVAALVRQDNTASLVGAARPARGFGPSRLTSWPCGFLLHRRFKLGKLRGLLFRNNLLALRRAIERHHLTQRQFAELSRRHIEPKCTVTDAANLLHMVADLFEHLPDLAVAAFRQSQLIPGIIAATNQLHLGRRSNDAVATATAHLIETATVDHDAAANLVEPGGRRNATGLHQVDLLNARSGLRKRVGAVAIVG